MKKVKGKALSLVLSLALVISSFSAIPASAATKTLNGSVNGLTHDSLYLVNGGSDEDLVFEGFGDYINADPTMTTPDHEDVSDVHIAAISHASGDRLVKWYDAAEGKQSSISSDTEDENIDLALRSSTVSGTETLNILYKGTYTDDNDVEYTVKDQKTVTVRVYNENETVIGTYDEAGTNGKGELDSNFAQKTAAYEKAKNFEEKDKSNPKADPKLTDSKDLIVLRAAHGTDPLLVEWEPLKTVPYSSENKEADLTSGEVYYQLKVTGDNVTLDDGKDYPEDASLTTENGTPTATTPGLALNEAKDKVVVSAPVNDYTYKYTINDGEAKDLTDDAISGLKTGDKVTVTAYDNGTAVADSKISFKYTAAVPGTPADPATLALEGTVKAEAPTIAFDDDDNPTTINVMDATGATEGDDFTYQVGASAAEDLSGVTTIDLPAEDTTIVLTNTTQNTSNTYTFTAGTPAGIDAPATIKDDAGTDVTGNASVVLAVDGDDVKVTNVPVTSTMTYSINDGEAQSAVDQQEIVVPNDGKIVVTATIDGETYTAKGTYSAVYAGGNPANYVTARVDVKANTGKLTFTAVATDFADAQDASGAKELYSTNDVKGKSAVDKVIKVTPEDDMSDFSKYSTSTYLFKGSVDKSSYTDAIKVNGYEVNFVDSSNNIAVKVDDKASVSKISGTVKSVTVSEGSVDSIALSDTGTPDVTVSDAKVGSIDFGSNKGTLDVNSDKAQVGNVSDAKDVTVTNGVVGNISASETVDVRAEDEDNAVTVGDITAKSISLDSDNSKVTAGALKASDADSEITLSGSFVKVASIDFDFRPVDLKLDTFDGSIPAPKNATKDGATISTNAVDDKVTINGDTDINSIAIGDDSQMIFDGELNVGSIDGSGTLVVGLGKMDISSDASGVILKFSDATLPVGTTAFTAVTDTVDVDSFENYGFTLSKKEGSKEDTFTIASTELVGLTFNPSSAEIPNGYSQKFVASAYAPGSALPDGYKIQYTLDGDSDIFETTNNDDGSITVKVIGYDKDFAEENKATLRAELVDTDGDVDDDYVAGELDLTALEVPKATYKSDTGSTLSIGGGFTYQFAVTSLVDGKVPTFGVGGSSFKTTYVGNSGNTYYYKVTAVGKVGDAAGVYINGEAAPSTVITITNPSDTAAVTVKAGNSYQFRVNGPSQPVFQVAGIGNIALTSKAGSNYYFKVNVPTNLAKGGHGVYNNGVLVAILTVA